MSPPSASLRHHHHLCSDGYGRCNAVHRVCLTTTHAPSYACAHYQNVAAASFRQPALVGSMPRTRRGVVGGGPTSVTLAPPGSLQYPNRRWVRHHALLGGRMLLCDCECGLHLTADGRLCVGEDGGIYGVAYCCPVCDVSLCGACHDAGHAHHQHRRSHTMEAVQPPPPSLQSGPGHAPLSAPPPSPRTVEWLQGVHCVTYDTYETDVYADERDCLVYYHLTAIHPLQLP